MPFDHFEIKKSRRLHKNETEEVMRGIYVSYHVS